jgi:hypothetical protein
MTSNYLVEKRYEECCVFEPHQHSQVHDYAQQKNLFPLPFPGNPPNTYPQVKIGCDSQEEQDDEPSSAFIIKE